VSGAKRFEFRENDRDYQVGDVLALADWEPQTAKYSGRHANVRVTYLFAGGAFGLPAKFCVMSIDALPQEVSDVVAAVRKLVDDQRSTPVSSATTKEST
jgi:hypothetical protein